MPDPVFIFWLHRPVDRRLDRRRARLERGQSGHRLHLHTESSLSRDNLGWLLVDMPDTMTKFSPLGLGAPGHAGGGAVAGERSLAFVLSGRWVKHAVRKLPKMVPSFFSPHLLGGVTAVPLR
ncbi:hypothetical protein ACRAWD_29775 [Caulobacter segnis]